MPKRFELSKLNISNDSPLIDVVARCSDAECCAFMDGEYLIREREENRDAFLILRGGFIVERESLDNASKKQIPVMMSITDIDDPIFIGEMAYLGGSARLASVRASGLLHTLKLKPAHIDIIIDSIPALSKILCRQLVARLAETSKNLREIEDLMTLDTQLISRAPGEVIVSRGEVATELFQLVDGELERDGGEAIPRSELMGGFINFPEYIKGCEAKETIIARSNALLVSISSSSRMAAIRSYPELVIEVLSDIG